MEVGDILTIYDPKGHYPGEVCVMAINANSTLTVIKRDGGGVENVKLGDLCCPNFHRIILLFLYCGPRSWPH